MSCLKLNNCHIDPAWLEMITLSPVFFFSPILGSQQINQRGVPGPPCQSQQERPSGRHQGRLQGLHHLAHRYVPAPHEVACETLLYTTWCRLMSAVLSHQVCRALGRPRSASPWRSTSCPVASHATPWTETTSATAWTRTWASRRRTARRTSGVSRRWPSCSPTPGWCASPASSPPSVRSGNRKASKRKLTPLSTELN